MSAGQLSSLDPSLQNTLRLYTVWLICLCQALQVPELIRKICGNGTSGPQWQFTRIIPKPGSVNLITTVLLDQVRDYISIGAENVESHY